MSRREKPRLALLSPPGRAKAAPSPPLASAAIDVPAQPAPANATVDRFVSGEPSRPACDGRTARRRARRASAELRRHTPAPLRKPRGDVPLSIALPAPLAERLARACALEQVPIEQAVIEAVGAWADADGASSGPTRYEW